MYSFQSWARVTEQVRVSSSISVFINISISQAVELVNRVTASRSRANNADKGFFLFIGSNLKGVLCV